MSRSDTPGRPTCPACGRTYGVVGTSCYPGVSALVAAEEGRTPMAGWCGGGFGSMGIPWPSRREVVNTVKNLRTAGASWDVVARTLARYGLKVPPGIQSDLRPTTRGEWPPRQPEPTPDGPRPPVRRDPRPPLPPGVQDPRQAPGRAHQRPYTDAPQESDRTRGCPESVTGHGQPDRNGDCPWCGTKISSKLPAPRTTDRTRLGEEYRRHYDPDHGTDHRDT